MHPDIGPFFRRLLAGNRGDIEQVLFKRMPMGWKNAPSVPRAYGTHSYESEGWRG